MKIRLYPLDYYTHSGNLKPPVLFNLVLIFLARTWGLLIISLLLRESGQTLLALFYPDKIHFYLGLVSGSMALWLFFLSGRDHDKHPWVAKLWRNSYPFLLLSIFIDLALQLYYLLSNHFQYSFAASVQLVFAVWILLYCLKSKHLRDSFIGGK
ncbi:DUF2919 domain-containing protein [Psychromonas sp.]|uniref:DUF2919 domain-containing protein n=1 Tax=Psychromonas sp. TaxID=1884585 RepID=UPI003561B49F